MTDREAMKMALAKLEHLWEIGIDAEYKVELLPEIEVLRQALAQPEQEELIQFKDGKWSYVRKPWVGLTDDEIDWIFGLAYADDMELLRTIEAKLKDKNG